MMSGQLPEDDIADRKRRTNVEAKLPLCRQITGADSLSSSIVNSKQKQML